MYLFVAEADKILHFITKLVNTTFILFLKAFGLMAVTMVGSIIIAYLRIVVVNGIYWKSLLKSVIRKVSYFLDC